MKINVLLVCYNQSQYIRSALEGIVMQRAGCDVEVLVADDCSTDDTLRLIREFEPRSPFPFRYLSAKCNLGLARNYERAFAASDGDYVAILEGDDYWTSPDHLGNHLRFLDSHREVVLSMNRIHIYEEPTRRYATWYAPEMTEEYRLYTTQDMAGGNKLGNLSACVIRNRSLQNLPQELFEEEIFDWMLGMILSERGYLAVLKPHTSLYRVKGSGLWAGKSVEKHRGMILTAIERYDQYFKGKYREEFGALRRTVLEEAEKERSKGLSGRLLISSPQLRKALRNLTPPLLANLIRRW